MHPNAFKDIKIDTSNFNMSSNIPHTYGDRIFVYI